MKVKELIEFLKGLNENLHICIPMETIDEFDEYKLAKEVIYAELVNLNEDNEIEMPCIIIK